VATPIRTSSGTAVGAVSISGFVDRILDKDLPRRAANVMTAARSIALGLAPDGNAGEIGVLYSKASQARKAA